MSLQEVLIELRKTYLASIPTKMIYIETLWRTRDIEHLKTEFHKLKGTGRTYGLPEISQLGAAMERLCEIDTAPFLLLGETIPPALKLMSFIKEHRENGIDVASLDAQTDFQTIVGVIEKTGL